MSEPTVEEVRARYARAIRTEHDRTWQSGADEFDDWLARVKREAAAEALEATVTGISPERIRAAARLLADSGDITPQGVRVLDQICDDEERKKDG